MAYAYFADNLKTKWFAINRTECVNFKTAQIKMSQKGITNDDFQKDNSLPLHSRNHKLFPLS